MKKPKPIRLSLTQLMQAEQVATARQQANAASPNLGFRGNRSRQPEAERRGAIAECAVAALTGLPWHAVDDQPDGPMKADVGPLEVKSVASWRHKLIVHRNRNLNLPHLLCVVDQPRVWIRGWCFGFEVYGRYCWWDDTLPVPAFARPGDTLYGSLSLRNWCASYGLKWGK